MSKQITNKRMGIMMAVEGHFNTQPAPLTSVELLGVAKATDKVMVRQMGVTGGGICIPNLEPLEAIKRKIQLERSGETNLYYGIQLPVPLTSYLFQGDYGYGDDGEFLRISNTPALFREAMLTAKEFSGASCRIVLRDCLDHRSYGQLIELAEAYPDHIVEFTLVDRPCGIYNERLMIWEVRKY